MLHKKMLKSQRFWGKKPAEGAFDAFCPGRVVARWHKLAAATPSTSGFFYNLTLNGILHMGFL